MCRGFYLIWRTARAGRWRSCGGGLIAAFDREGFFLRERDGVKEGLHRGLSEAPASLMWPRLIVAVDPGIEVGLQLGERPVDLLTERHAIERMAFRTALPLWEPRLSRITIAPGLSVGTRNCST